MLITEFIHWFVLWYVGIQFINVIVKQLTSYSCDSIAKPSTSSFQHSLLDVLKSLMVQYIFCVKRDYTLIVVYNTCMFVDLPDSHDVNIVLYIN